MTNKSKNKGTAAETAVVNYLKVNGFPHAKRLTLSGRYDKGDVSLGDGYQVTVEVKGGTAAETASDAQIVAWVDEAHAEMLNAGMRFCVLVTKRKGKSAANAGAWLVHTDTDCYLKLIGVDRPEDFPGHQMVTFSLSFFVTAMQLKRPVTGQQS